MPVRRAGTSAHCVLDAFPLPKVGGHHVRRCQMLLVARPARLRLITLEAGNCYSEIRRPSGELCVPDRVRPARGHFYLPAMHCGGGAPSRCALRWTSPLRTRGGQGAISACRVAALQTRSPSTYTDAGCGYYGCCRFGFILSAVQLPLPFNQQTTGDAAPAPYFIRHRRARRYVLRLDPDGRVRVTIPRGGSLREAQAFVSRHQSWIERQRAQLTSSIVAADDIRALKARARLELPVRLLEMASGLGLQVVRVSIRNQRTRWGSCGRDGHICLNWRLVLMPEWVRDYVLVHELIHLRRLDHSPAYWRLVAAAYPSFREARAWLRVNGPALR